MYGSLYVFMISAFWHGYYIGYYFSFFLWFAQVYLQTLIFKLMEPRNGEEKKNPFWLTISATMVANWFFSHNGAFFYMLEA